MRLRELLQAGPAQLARVAARRLWSSSRSLGLRCDLRELPEARPAKEPVRMEATEPRAFGGFGAELEHAGPEDSVELLQRERMCRAGVTTLFVATRPDGSPMYAQWLVRPSEQAPLHGVTGGLFPQLGPSETLIEGAFTFAAARGLGAMADGMRQLLQTAADEGYTAAITYVAGENVPSLKGCARVGFDLDHVRVVRRRIGIRSIERVAPDDEARAQWRAAVG